MSKRAHDPRRLDVAAACADGAVLSGDWPLGGLERLADGNVCAAPVTWSAGFEQRPMHAAGPQLWLHLEAAAGVPRECQRCLQAVLVPLSVDRWVRFVDDEATAAALDADSDEDVLVASRSLDLQALVEDELLLAMPLVPMHETCPTWLAPPQPEPPQADHPFAALAALKRGRGR